MTATWTTDELTFMQEHWTKGYSASQIASAMVGRSRSAVLGKLHRITKGQPVARQRPEPAAKPIKPRKPRATMSRPGPSMPEIAPDADMQINRAKAWEPLSGTTPVPLDQRCGCCWPVGASPFLFCNAEKVEGSQYCHAHHMLSLRR